MQHRRRSGSLGQLHGSQDLWSQGDGPQTGQRLLISTDDAWTWKVAWLPNPEALLAEHQVHGWDSRLVGPIAGSPHGGPSRWYLVIGERITLEIDPTRPLAPRWVALPAQPEAVPVAVTADGLLLFFVRDERRVFEEPPTSFRQVEEP